jgi:hypothetical protein
MHHNTVRYSHTHGAASRRRSSFIAAPKAKAIQTVTSPAAQKVSREAQVQPLTNAA